MKRRKIGGSELELSVITFGAWAAGGWMWGGTDRAEAVRAIRAAYDAGVTSIDTAPAYGQGASEEIVGEALRGIPREKVQILTKFGLRWDTTHGSFYFKSTDNAGKPIDLYRWASRQSIMEECEASLRRLGTEYIDLYQIHWPDSTTPAEETMGALQRLLEEGKVRHAGVCNYDVAQMQEAEKHLTLLSDQVPYSMVRRQIEQDLIPYIQKNGKSVIAYSPLQLGLLTGKMKPGHQFAAGDHRGGLSYFKDENIRRVNQFLDSLRPIADAKHATLGQLVLRWTIEQPGITIALAGARNERQAMENAAAGDITLDPGELAFIADHLNNLELIR